MYRRTDTRGGFKMSTYLNRKVNKKAENVAAGSIRSKVALRVLIVFLLGICVVKGCGWAVDASHNASIPDWKIVHYRCERLRELSTSPHFYDNSEAGKAWWDSTQAWWKNDDNARRAYIENER